MIHYTAIRHAKHFDLSIQGQSISCQFPLYIIFESADFCSGNKLIFFKFEMLGFIGRFYFDVIGVHTRVYYRTNKKKKKKRDLLNGGQS